MDRADRDQNNRQVVHQLQMDPRLLEILVCPLTWSTLTYDKTKQELISKSAKLAFPIRDGIPIMLVYEARAMDDSPR
jgi:uncharacterized protein